MMHWKSLPAVLLGLAAACSVLPAGAQHFRTDTALMTRLVRDTSYEIAPGVRETDITYLNKAGKPEAVYILRARLKKGRLGLEASTPFAKDTFCRQTLLEQMHWADGPHHRIVAGVNADFFDMSNGIPLLMEMSRGKILKDPSRPGRPFMGVLKNGRVIIGDSAVYAKKSGSLREALGGAQLLVQGGKIELQRKDAFSLTRHPRTAAGIVNARTLLLVVVDGRHPDYSNGIPLDELARLMKDLGAKEAINLDGGGSSTLVSLDPVTGTRIDRNRPSGGRERAVANGWVLVRYR